jgi:hypothetical protein
MNLDNALIGATGFIGSNLNNRFQFNQTYDSKNIGEIKGRHFNNIYCAAPGATKWQINKNPTSDRLNITSLLKNLESVKCNRFILISTIDVLTFKNPLSYGGNRLFFENKILEIYNNKTMIVRLPGLFGNGLKKNIIYDLQNKNCEFVNLNSSFQWLSVSRFLDFLEKNKNSTGLFELYSESLETKELVLQFFPNLYDLCAYHQRTKYEFKPDNGFFINKEQVIKDLGEFFENK